MIKVRFFTWYYGNYCLANKTQASNLPDGFCLYDDELDGWHNSEEYKRGKIEPYQNQEKDTLDYFMNSSYYINGSWKKYYNEQKKRGIK